MKVAQRASSAATSDGTEGYKTLDRWRILYSSSAGGAATMSQDTTVPNTSFANSLKLDVTTADTSIDVNHAITLQYRFEAQDIANSGWDYTNSNSNMSVSFWARSVKAGTYCVFFFTQDGTTKNLVQEYTLEANTWKYVTLKFKGDSGISFDDDNGLGLIVGWTLVAGANRYESVTAGTWITTSSGNGQGRYATSNQVNFFDSTSNDFYLTGVQIEVGSQASPFEHEPISTTLAKCQRYFEVTDQDQEIYATGSCWTTSAAYGFIPFMVEKRVSPTSLGRWKGAATDYRFRTKGSNYQCTSLTMAVSNASTRNARFDLSVGSGLVAGDSGWLSHSGNTTQLYFDSEL